MYVLDVSVVVKWYTEEEGSDQARRLLVDRIPAIAPAFLAVEFSNVMWKLVRRASIELDTAQLYCLDLPLNLAWWVPDGELLSPALGLASRHNHPVYDCLYVSLAIRENAPLITADRRLAERFSTLADIRIL